MADLRVNFLGLELSNPVIIGSGPLNRCGLSMKKGIAAGAGAVITETIVNEVRKNVRPRLVKKDNGLQNIRLYSDYTLEEWEKEISLIKKVKSVCIANIMGHTPSEMAYIAGHAEKFGADAVELNSAIPHGEGLEVLSAKPDIVYELVNRVVKTVDIPVMLKLSPNVSNIAALAQAAEKAGASGISAINTVRSILGIDIETGKPLLPTFGGYSGEPIRPIGLAAVATAAQAVNLEISGIGGISSWEHAVEYIMLGAKTVQLQTSVILKGYEQIEKILNGLSAWMDKKGYASIEDFRGKALSKLKSFEEIRVEPYTAVLSNPCPRPDCRLCITGCLYNAIAKSAALEVCVDQNLCSGCGLCLSVCPEGCFSLDWGE